MTSAGPGATGSVYRGKECNQGCLELQVQHDARALPRPEPGPQQQQLPSSLPKGRLDLCSGPRSAGSSSGRRD